MTYWQRHKPVARSNKLLVFETKKAWETSNKFHITTRKWLYNCTFSCWVRQSVICFVGQMELTLKFRVSTHDLTDMCDPTHFLHRKYSRFFAIKKYWNWTRVKIMERKNTIWMHKKIIGVTNIEHCLLFYTLQNY